MSEAEEVWNNLFPSANKVHFNAFLTIFENYFRNNFPLNCQPNISFQRILKHSIVLNDNFVTKKSFENFLKLFGPLRLSLVKVCSNLFDNNGILNPWFHGSLSREQSSIILKTLPEGNYLVRLSETQPGNFTIVYVANDNKPKNVLVYNYQECGYGLDQNRENCGEGRTFDNLPAFITLHSAKLRYPIQSPLYTACINEGPSLNTQLLAPPKIIGSPSQNSFTSPSQQQQLQQQQQHNNNNPHDEDPYGTFSLNIQTQNLTINPPILSNPSTRQFIIPNTPQTPTPSFDDMENPYGYFGMDTATPPISNNNNNNNSNNNNLLNTSPFQNNSRNISYPQISPNHLGLQSGTSQIFSFQSTSSSQLSLPQDTNMEDNYGYFNPDVISMPNEIQRIVSHDQILSITSSDGNHVDLPYCSRSSSDPAAKSNNDIFLHPMKVRQNISYRMISTNGTQAFPQINRSELSCLLDESSHRGREGKHREALEITTLVDQEIRNYIENVKKLQDSKPSDLNGDRKNERTSSIDSGDLAGETAHWIPPTISTEDLRLLAKTLAQKGDIQKAMGAEITIYCAAYQESHDVLQTLFHRLERSDRGYFEDMQSFGRIHRKLAMIHFSEKNYELAEYHFAEELGMMLLDCDMTSRNHAVRNLSELKISTPEFAKSGTEKESQNLLNQGIASFNKGLQGYPVAAELLTKCIRSSRLCGSLMTELRALGNLATVESTRGNQYDAIRYYTQCVILCRHLNDTTTLKKILYKQVTCFMTVSLYNKALSCIDQLMIIATSLQNIEKLEDLKEKARKQLVARTNVAK